MWFYLALQGTGIRLWQVPGVAGLPLARAGLSWVDQAPRGQAPWPSLAELQLWERCWGRG